MSNKNTLRKNIIGNFFVNYFQDHMGILIGFFALLFFLSLFAKNFFTYGNLLNVMRAVSTNAFLGIGILLTIMLAGIDLSGGAIIALSGVVTVSLLAHTGMNIPCAVLVGIAVGTLFGLLNGLIIAYMGIHPFVVTLATQSICRGAAYLVAGGQPVAIMNNKFCQFGIGHLGIIPYPAIYMVFFLIMASVLLNYTRYGRHIYAVGGNPIASKYSGINIEKVQIITWTLSGFLAAFGGVVLASRMSSGQPAVGIGFETDGIAASVLGGASFFGGTGSIGGLVIGIFIIGMISNGLNLLHINSYWQYVVKGMIIILAVYVDLYKQKRDTIKESKSKID